jgi:hypothetical protein
MRGHLTPDSMAMMGGLVQVMKQDPAAAAGHLTPLVRRRIAVDISAPLPAGVSA